MVAEIEERRNEPQADCLGDPRRGAARCRRQGFEAGRAVAACMKARFPIALQEHGISAYLFYAGAKYERNGRIVDTFDNVRAAAAPVLEEGIELLKPGNEPDHQSIHTP